MSKTFVIGDIHGSHRALLQCLKNSAFNYDCDTLICLGDVCDGWPETSKAIDELLKIKNLIYVLGNHDFWALDWMETGQANEMWLGQGGQATIDSYAGMEPEAHAVFLRKALPYYLKNNQLFVHAGIQVNQPLFKQGIQTFLWDRSFAQRAKEKHDMHNKRKLTQYEAVFIGHTPILEARPRQYCEVWMMDTGAGWSGVLSMMNVENLECFISDSAQKLYPGIEGRRKF